MSIADPLSRAPLPTQGKITKSDREMENVCALEDLDLMTAEMNTIREETAKKQTLQEIIQLLKDGWPEMIRKRNTPPATAVYF